MPDELDPTPTPPPANPATVAEILPFFPVSYEYGKQFALVFSQELADILAEKQAESGGRFIAKPVELTDGRFMLCGDIMSECPNGLYQAGFGTLDLARFNEIEVLPLADGLALIPQNEDPVSP